MADENEKDLATSGSPAADQKVTESVSGSAQDLLEEYDASLKLRFVDEASDWHDPETPPPAQKESFFKKHKKAIIIGGVVVGVLIAGGVVVKVVKG